MPISETPHFQYISTSRGKEVYYQYKKDHFNLEKNYVENKFDSLISSMNKIGLNNQILISKDMTLPYEKRANILDEFIDLLFIVKKSQYCRVFYCS